MYLENVEFIWYACCHIVSMGIEDGWNKEITISSFLVKDDGKDRQQVVDFTIDILLHNYF